MAYQIPPQSDEKARLNSPEQIPLTRSEFDLTVLQDQITTDALSVASTQAPGQDEVTDHSGHAIQIDLSLDEGLAAQVVELVALVEDPDEAGADLSDASPLATEQSDDAVPANASLSSGADLVDALSFGIEGSAIIVAPGYESLRAYLANQQDAGGGEDSVFGYSIPNVAGGSLYAPFESSAPLGDISYAKPSGAGGGGGKPTADSGTGGTGDTSGGDVTLLSSYTSGLKGGYNIELVFQGDWSADPALADIQQDFVYAADLLSTIILEDVPDVIAAGFGKIDDITIVIGLEQIDGVGNVVGYAGSVSRTADPGQPYYAEIVFDIDDVLATVGTDSFAAWDDVAVHEMIHSIGFSATVFEALGLIENNGGIDYFIGAETVALYGGPVPLENDGGSGTASSHWEESLFGDEVMTGYINMAMPTTLSGLTVAALSDIGYSTLDSSTWSDLTIGDSVAMV